LRHGVLFMVKTNGYIPYLNQRGCSCRSSNSHVQASLVINEYPVRHSVRRSRSTGCQMLDNMDVEWSWAEVLQTFVRMCNLRYEICQVISVTSAVRGPTLIHIRNRDNKGCSQCWKYPVAFGVPRSPVGCNNGNGRNGCPVVNSSG
jgi:hypothetical protein